MQQVADFRRSRERRSVVEYGIGIDANLGLSFAEMSALAREAAQLGYTSAWSPSNPPARDGFHACAQWSTATQDLAGGCLATGIAVIPVGVWTVNALVQQAGALSELSGGRFTLGIGTGQAYSPDFWASIGRPQPPIVALMRDYLITLRQLLAGETVDYDGKAVSLHGVRATMRPLPVPLYVAALGPQMLRLTGELADGDCLNWSTPAQRAWCREQIAIGARKAGRDPSSIKLMEYIRVCIDEDEEVARRGLARALMGYALGKPGAANDQGYRGHFTRMGFDDLLKGIEAQRDAGASESALIDAFPVDFLQQMGYFGKAAGAPAALRKLSEGLDTAVVRIVNARPGVDAARTTVQACRPDAVLSL
jgi:alkanesulfonate monooxygenase SsuD/methylene tetrahydromethanopterin reductase-like flavin-dependent oxidoreductase (luciferase family)